MREFKFRGKRVDGNGWHYGFYREFQMVDVWKMEAYRDGINYYIDAKDTNECHLVIPETVGQHTELIDKTGKDVFEGDLVKGKDALYLVIWDVEKVGYHLEVIKSKCTLIATLSFPIWQHVKDGILYDLEIVGNIHDNPELLE